LGACPTNLDEAQALGGCRGRAGADAFAAFRSVVSTAKANRASVLDTIRCVLAAKLPAGPIAGVGRAITPSPLAEDQATH